MTAKLLEMQARESLAMPAEWFCYRFECLPKGAGETTHFQVRGMVAPILSKGKRKGFRDWSKGDESTDMIFTCSVAAQQAWADGWSKREGKCVECLGERTVFVGWSVKEGTRTRECPKCNGTGKP